MQDRWNAGTKGHLKHVDPCVVRDTLDNRGLQNVSVGAGEWMARGVLGDEDDLVCSHGLEKGRGRRKHNGPGVLPEILLCHVPSQPQRAGLLTDLQQRTMLLVTSSYESMQ